MDKFSSIKFGGDKSGDKNNLQNKSDLSSNISDLKIKDKLNLVGSNLGSSMKNVRFGNISKYLLPVLGVFLVLGALLFFVVINANINHSF